MILAISVRLSHDISQCFDTNPLSPDCTDEPFLASSAVPDLTCLYPVYEVNCALNFVAHDSICWLCPKDLRSLCRQFAAIQTRRDLKQYYRTLCSPSGARPPTRFEREEP